MAVISTGSVMDCLSEYILPYDVPHVYSKARKDTGTNCKTNCTEQDWNTKHEAQ